MANPIIKVILSAVDEVTDVAKKATHSVEGFASKAATVIRGLAALAAGSALGAFFKSAVEEAAAAEVQMGRLGTAVRNAGGNFGALRPDLEKTVAAVLRMSTATDDDLREALTRLIALSGNVAASQQNLALVTDLAAFKQIGLSEAADIVGKAMNGNTTAFNKMGIAGKDATTVLESARASFGGFAANEATTFSGGLTQVKNQWGEFQEAVGAAVVGNEGARDSIGKLAGMLADLAGWVERNEAPIGRVTDALLSMGNQVVVAGGAIWDSLRPALSIVIVPLKLLLSGVQTLSYGFGLFAQVVKYTVGDALDAIGNLLGLGAQALNAFGIKVGYEVPLRLKESGQRMQIEAAFGVERVRGVFKAGMDALWADRKEGHDALESEEQAHGGRVRRVSQDQIDARLKAEREAAAERERILKDVNAKLLAAQKGLNLATAELAGYWQQVDREARKAQSTIGLSAGVQAQLEDRTQSTAKAQQVLAEQAAVAKTRISETAERAATLARGAIDAAQAMGVISSEAASALSSVVNMAAALPKALGGDAASIVGVVGGLANLIANLASNPAEQIRNTIIQRNSDALNRLAKEVGFANLSATGKQFANLQQVFGGIATEGARLAGGSRQEQKVGRIALQKQLRTQLTAAGISVGDATKLFEQMDLPDLAQIFTTDDETLFFKLLPQAIAALNSGKLGAGADTFDADLGELEDFFDVMGVEDADDKLVKFRELVGRYSPTLAAALTGDLSTKEGRNRAIANLRQLWVDLDAGKVDLSRDQASAPQIRSVIKTLLPLLGDADGVPAPKGPALGSVGTPGGGTSAGPAIGATVAGAFGGVYADGLGVGGLGTVPLGSSLLGGPPGGGGAGGPGGALGAALAGVTVTFNEGAVVLSFPNAATSGEALEQSADQIADILGRRLTLQLHAQGRQSI